MRIIIDMHDGHQILGVVYDWLEAEQLAPTNERVAAALKRLATFGAAQCSASIPRSQLLALLHEDSG